MAAYESMFILQPELESEAEAEVLDNLQALFQKLGGEVRKIDDWGKKKPPPTRPPSPPSDTTTSSSFQAPPISSPNWSTSSG